MLKTVTIDEGLPTQREVAEVLYRDPQGLIEILTVDVQDLEPTDEIGWGYRDGLSRVCRGPLQGEYLIPFERPIMVMTVQCPNPECAADIAVDYTPGDPGILNGPPDVCVQPTGPEVDWEICDCKGGELGKETYYERMCDAADEEFERLRRSYGGDY